MQPLPAHGLIRSHRCNASVKPISDYRLKRTLAGQLLEENPDRLIGSSRFNASMTRLSFVFCAMPR